MILALFDDEAGLARALERFREARIAPIETYTPAPLQGEPVHSPIPLAMLVAGLAGAAASFALQSYSLTNAYPFPVGGRPQIAWPSFIPTAFENGVLLAIAAGFLAFMLINRMPRLYDPVDESDLMRRASRDGWLLLVATAELVHDRSRPRPAVRSAAAAHRGTSAMRRHTVCLLLMTVALAGCDDMIHQAKNNTYSDARVGPGKTPPGMVDYRSKPEAPPPVTLALMERGQQRFRIYCTPCHSELGDGNGMIVQRGFPAPPSYHIARLRQAPVQHFYDVITNGHGVMYAFADRVAPADRWAIAAYIRALQRSQDATLADLTPEQRAALP